MADAIALIGGELVAPAARAPRYVGPRFDSYPDLGCRYHAACLTCPFVRCLYEEPGGPRGRQTARYRERDTVIRFLFAAGISVEQIADAAGLARRTVYRILGPVGRRHRI